MIQFNGVKEGDIIRFCFWLTDIRCPDHFSNCLAEALGAEVPFPLAPMALCSDGRTLLPRMGGSSAPIALGLVWCLRLKVGVTMKNILAVGNIRK